jgi:hypothetical protein
VVGDHETSFIAGIASSEFVKILEIDDHVILEKHL